MNSFLKKLGQIARGIGQVAGIGGPIITALYPRSTAVVGNTLDVTSGIANAVISVEVLMNGKTPAEKLTGATQLATVVVKTSNLLDGKKIKDEALFVKGCTKMTDGMVDVLNSLEAQ